MRLFDFSNISGYAYMFMIIVFEAIFLVFTIDEYKRASDILPKWENIIVSIGTFVFCNAVAGVLMILATYYQA